MLRMRTGLTRVGGVLGLWAFGCAAGGGAVAGPPLNAVSFKATHNAYALNASPWDQILYYNVWELEIDFGQYATGEPLTVGHAGPADCNSVDCWLCDCPDWGIGWNLVDWLAAIASAAESVGHPILLKLEANTVCPPALEGWCWMFWDWPDVWDWDSNWQQTLRSHLLSTIGAGRIYTPSMLADFRAAHPGELWPPVSELAGKFLVSLKARDGETLAAFENPDPLMFIPHFPDLSVSPGGAYWDDEDDQERFFRDLSGRPVRMVMDGAFMPPWSYWGVHPPVPVNVDPATTVYPYNTGTVGLPVVRVGHAAAMARTIPVLPGSPHPGYPAEAVLSIRAGVYPERLTLTQPMTLTAAGGAVTIGGAEVAYTIWLQVADVADAGTAAEQAYAILHGSAGSSGEIRLNSMAALMRASANVTQVTAGDYGELQSVTIRLPSHDHLLLQGVYVDSGTTGRHYFANGSNLWVGYEHAEYRTFGVTARWP